MDEVKVRRSKNASLSRLFIQSVQKAIGAAKRGSRKHVYVPEQVEPLTNDDQGTDTG
jgi:hypothetical protein